MMLFQKFNNIQTSDSLSTDSVSKFDNRFISFFFPSVSKSSGRILNLIPWLKVLRSGSKGS